MINKKLKILVSASPFCEHDLKPINILKKINGKKIKSVEVLVKLED